MKVSELMDPKGVLLYAKIDNSADALGILVELQEGIGVITNGNAYYNAVSQRETFGGTTAIGGGIALPHASNAGVSAPGISALLLRRGVDWGAPDGQPVDLVFMIAVPPKSESLHLQILARLVNLLGRRDLVEALRTASNPQRFVELIAKTENACFADSQGTSRLLQEAGMFVFNKNWQYPQKNIKKCGSIIRICSCFKPLKCAIL